MCVSVYACMYVYVCVCVECNMYGCEIGTKSIRYKIVPIFLNNTAQLHIHGEDETSRTSGPSSCKMKFHCIIAVKFIAVQIRSRWIRSRISREREPGAHRR